jgi:hypothetical protein
MKMAMPKAPWSAVALATAFRWNSKATASLRHSKALRAFFMQGGEPKVQRNCSPLIDAGKR